MDDFILEVPLESLMGKLKNFGMLAGFKINNQKMNKNMKLKDQIELIGKIGTL